jgi:hypothetical protein
LLGENGVGARSRGQLADKFAYEDFANGTRGPAPAAPLGTKEKR